MPVADCVVAANAELRCVDAMMDGELRDLAISGCPVSRQAGPLITKLLEQRTKLRMVMTLAKLSLEMVPHIVALSHAESRRIKPFHGPGYLWVTITKSWRHC